MHDSLIAYIKKYSTTPLKEGDDELIKNTFLAKRIRKKQFLLQEGEVCKYTAFIVKGAMRQYSVDEKGTEHIVRLTIENWWAVDRESFTMLTPSVYNIDAWEDTDALLVTRADFLSNLGGMPALNEMTRKMDENHASALQKRVIASISFSAEKRYEDFARQYPEFIQRFPQHIIASYLGITKETLSRIRHQLVKK